MNRKSTYGSSGFVLSEKTYSDDGKTAFENHRRSSMKRLKHKDDQLLKQYERTLNLIFSGEISDPDLNDLVFNQARFGNSKDILYVELLVIGDSVASERTISPLESYLRRLLAEAMNKKRIPSIQIILLGNLENRSIYHAD